MSGLLEGGHKEGQAGADVSASAPCFLGLMFWGQGRYLCAVLMGRPRVAASNGASVRRWFGGRFLLCAATAPRMKNTLTFVPS